MFDYMAWCYKQPRPDIKQTSYEMYQVVSGLMMSNMKFHHANTIDDKVLVLPMWGCHLLVVDPRSAMIPTEARRSRQAEE